jgi:hypothetical protein
VHRPAAFPWGTSLSKPSSDASAAFSSSISETFSFTVSAWAAQAKASAKINVVNFVVVFIPGNK